MDEGLLDIFCKTMESQTEELLLKKSEKAVCF